ncbi:MAG: hypothetical protein ACRDLS_11755 [Solirubrobacteraceae bacterium]
MRPFAADDSSLLGLRLAHRLVIPSRREDGDAPFDDDVNGHLQRTRPWIQYWRLNVRWATTVSVLGMALLAIGG